MATVCKYCKAYPLQTLCKFSGWTEQGENARKDADLVRPLADDNYLYLQENYVVTDGIYKDENIIFDRVTPEWIAYCQDVLKFEPPSYGSTSTQGPAD
jgi:hypothetical protein